MWLNYNIIPPEDSESRLCLTKKLIKFHSFSFSVPTNEKSVNDSFNTSAEGP
jgi:hypothetical protein